MFYSRNIAGSFGIASHSSLGFYFLFAETTAEDVTVDGALQQSDERLLRGVEDKVVSGLAGTDVT